MTKYKCKWSRRERVDIRALNEWECKVNECVRNRIASLKRKHKSEKNANKRHSRSLEELRRKYVLVPADKAAQNVIIVCKKYYLEVVLKDIDTTAT